MCKGGHNCKVLNKYVALFFNFIWVKDILSTYSAYFHQILISQHKHA